MLNRVEPRMDILQIFSILQVYWVVQGLYYFLLTLIAAISGRHWKKAHHLSAVDKPLLWWQFRKRVTLFYMVGFFTTFYLIFSILKSSCLGWTSWHWVQSFLYAITGPSQSNVDTTSCLVGCLIYFSHMICRLYQCTFISIHSWRQVLGPFWVGISYANQIGSAVSLIAEGPKFDGTFECFTFTKLRIRHFVAIVVYVFAANIQFNTFTYLTSLRKNKAGHVVTTSYKLPQNGFFRKLGISSPHYFAEILAHLAVLVALGTNSHTWMALTYQVACQMTYLAYVTHQYYLKKFPNDYPKERNILIPFLF